MTRPAWSFLSRAALPCLVAAALVLCLLPAAVRAQGASGAADEAWPGSPPAPAAEQPTREAQPAVSFRFGINHVVLDRPNDQPGEVTLLSGSAFTGNGLLLGATYEHAGLGVSWLSLEGGLFFAHSTASGLSIVGEMQREILVEANTLRLPVWLKAKWAALPELRVFVGTGPELLYGVNSASTIREVNIPEDQQGFLETQSVTTFQWTGLVGAEVDIGPVVIPLSIHASVNPLVGDKTADRLEGTSSVNNPGRLRMEFDYEFLFLLGVAYEL
jgi:hypothetical protein